MDQFYRKIMCALLAGSLAAGLLAGCGNSAGEKADTEDTAASGENSALDKTGGDGGEITIGVTSFADTLEPTEQYFSWVVSRYGVGETLVRFDENGEIVPCLAESWEISEDQLTWTFKIREGVKFSNGDDMTPELVKASLERTFELSDRAVSFFEPASMEVDGQNLLIKTTELTQTWLAALQTRCSSLWIPRRIRTPLPWKVPSVPDLTQWNLSAPQIPAL